MISIIIPTYNVEAYINECLNSLANQTLDKSKFEIIVVDDCSADNTLSLLTNFSKLKNLHILSNDKNAGPGKSRNKAIKHAKGEYLFFLDADDLIVANGLAIIDAYITTHAVDMLIYNWIDYDHYINHIQNTSMHKYNLPTNRSEAISMCIGLKNIDYTNNYKLIRTSVFVDNGLYYPSGLHEDILLTLQFHYFSTSTHLINDTIYIRRSIRQNSTMNTFTPLHIDGLLNAWDAMLAFAKNNATEAEFKQYLRFFYSGISGVIANIIRKINTVDNELERSRLSQFLIEKLSDKAKLFLDEFNDFPVKSTKDKMTINFLNSILIEHCQANDYE